MLQIAKDQKIVIVTVGLPATGKTYLCNKISRYINWLGFEAEVFSIGTYIKKLFGQSVSAEFFDPFNKEAYKMRQKCDQNALDDLIAYLQKEDSTLAIYDGANVTQNKRLYVQHILKKSLPNLSIIFVESIITQQDMIEYHIKYNIQNELENDKSEEQAIADYFLKVKQQSKAYETITDDEDLAYIKVYNSGLEVKIFELLYFKYTVKNIQGFLESKVVTFIMNLHFSSQKIYFSRHGQSMYNVEDRVGGDCDLSEQGYKYAQRLGEFMETQFSEDEKKELKFLTSTLLRAYTTASFIKLGIEPERMRPLDEIATGICDGMTYKEIEENFPVIHTERKKDKLGFRYPRGESYLDLISRIEPVIFEIERSAVPVIIIAHQAVLRCLYAYFTNNDKSIISEIPNISIPLHTVFKMEPRVYFTKEIRYVIDIESGKVTEEAIQPWSIVKENQNPLFI